MAASPISEAAKEAEEKSELVTGGKRMRYRLKNDHSVECYATQDDDSPAWLDVTFVSDAATPALAICAALLRTTKTRSFS